MDTPGPGRRTYLDLLRGVAVLVMIEAHVIDSWTRIADRHSWQFAWAMILGGLKASVIARQWVPFGPVLTARAGWLQRQCLLERGRRVEEVVAIRADVP